MRWTIESAFWQSQANDGVFASFTQYIGNRGSKTQMYRQQGNGSI